MLLLEQQQRPVNIPQRRGQSIATSTGRRVDGYLGGIVKLQRRPPQPSHRTSGGAGPHREIRAAVETSQGAASTADCAGSAGFKPGPLPPLSHTGPNTGVGGIVEACSSLFDAAAMYLCGSPGGEAEGESCAGKRDWFVQPQRPHAPASLTFGKRQGEHVGGA